MEAPVLFIKTNATAAAATTAVSDNLSIAIITLLLTFLLHLCFIFYQRNHGGSLRAQTYRSCSTTAAANNSLCTVCLHDINDGERYRKLPECEHCFHVDCIDAWFECRSTCPLCRNHVFVRRKRDRRRRGFIGYLLSFLWIIFKRICRYLDVDVSCDD